MNIKEFSKHLRNTGHIVVSENRRVQVREPLTDTERLQIASELAEQVKAAEEKEADMKDVQAQMKQELKVIQGSVALNSDLISKGYRMIGKTAVAVADFDQRTRILYDPDTGAEIAREPLQQDDYQVKAEIELAQESR